MWNKSANFLMVGVKLQNHREFTIPVSLWVVEELISALQDIAWLAEGTLKIIPLPQEESTRKYMRYARTIPLSNLIAIISSLIKDLGKHKGLDMVDVEVGDVQVKIHLR